MLTWVENLKREGEIDLDVLWYVDDVIVTGKGET